MLLIFGIMLVAVIVDAIRFFRPAICIRKRNIRAVCNESLCRLRPGTLNFPYRIPFAYVDEKPFSYFPHTTADGLRIRRPHRKRFFLTSLTLWSIVLLCVIRFFVIPNIIGKTVSGCIEKMQCLDSFVETIPEDRHAEKYLLHYNEKPAGDLSQNILMICLDEGSLSDMMYLLHIGNDPECSVQKCTLVSLQRDIAVQPVNAFQISMKESGLTPDSMLYRYLKSSYPDCSEEEGFCKLNETTQFYDRNQYGIQEKEAAKAHSRCRSVVLNVEKAFDIFVDHYVLVNYEGVIRCVDAFGGMEYDIPEESLEGIQNVLVNQNKIVGRSDTIEQSGSQLLNGNQVLALIRARKQENDGSNRARTVKGMNVIVSFAKQKASGLIEKGVSYYLDTPEMTTGLGLLYTDMTAEDAKMLKSFLCNWQHYSIDFGKTLPKDCMFEDYVSPVDGKMYIITGDFPTLHEQYEEVIS